MAEVLDFRLCLSISGTLPRSGLLWIATKESLARCLKRTSNHDCMSTRAKLARTRYPTLLVLGVEK
eukprot:392608-Amphidinium_carterae.1